MLCCGLRVRFLEKRNQCQEQCLLKEWTYQHWLASYYLYIQLYTLIKHERNERIWCETVWFFHIYTINPTLCVHPNLTFLITLLRESLRSTNPEYSYFSAGILANLLCDVHNPAWSDKHTLFHHVQDEMVSTAFKIFAQCRSQLKLLSVQ